MQKGIKSKDIIYQKVLSRIITERNFYDQHMDSDIKLHE